MHFYLYPSPYISHLPKKKGNGSSQAIIFVNLSCNLSYSLPLYRGVRSNGAHQPSTVSKQAMACSFTIKTLTNAKLRFSYIWLEHPLPTNYPPIPLIA